MGGGDVEVVQCPFIIKLYKWCKWYAYYNLVPIFFISLMSINVNTFSPSYSVA